MRFLDFLTRSEERVGGNFRAKNFQKCEKGICGVWRKTQSIFDSGKRNNTSKSDRIKKKDSQLAVLSYLNPLKSSLSDSSMVLRIVSRIIASM